MAEQTLTVHNSKLTYATIKKMVSLITEYTNIKTVLTYYFPSINAESTQWDSLRDNCEIFLQNNTNWIGTSPGSINSTQTSSVSSQINPSSVDNLYQKLLPLVDFNSTIDYTDSQTWYDILLKISSLLNISKEYTMHRQLFNSVRDLDTSVTKEPEQLVLYKDCEFPLPTNSAYPEKANYYAMREVVGDDAYYSLLPVYDIDTIVTGLTGYAVSLNYNVVKLTIGTGTYQHTGAVGCILKATEVSDGTNLPTISFTAHDTFVVSGFVASAEVRLIEISADTTTIAASAIPYVETPVVSSPDAGMGTYTPITFTSSSFAINDDSFDLHTKSHWQIASDTGFTSVVYDSLNDNINLESLTLVPSGILTVGTTYYWRVKYTGATYGDSAYSAYGTFATAEAYTCTIAAAMGGGIGAGTLNDNCVVAAKWDAEPTGTKTFRVAADTTAALVPAVAIGDLTYITDLDDYYINKTGTNVSLAADWILIDPIDEPNHSMFVASEVAQLALTVTTGNIAIRTDTDACYVNIDGTNAAMSDWILVDTPVKIWWLAKQYCANLTYGGYSDWYLPSASELNLLYTNKTAIDSADGTGNFVAWHYWSSTVDVLDQIYNAWEQDLVAGTQTTKDRDTRWYYVRPVRRL